MATTKLAVPTLATTEQEITELPPTEINHEAKNLEPKFETRGSPTTESVTEKPKKPPTTELPTTELSEKGKDNFNGYTRVDSSDLYSTVKTTSRPITGIYSISRTPTDDQPPGTCNYILPPYIFMWSNSNLLLIKIVINLFLYLNKENLDE